MGGVPQETRHFGKQLIRPGKTFCIVQCTVQCTVQFTMQCTVHIQYTSSYLDDIH